MILTNIVPLRNLKINKHCFDNENKIDILNNNKIRQININKSSEWSKAILGVSTNDKTK